MLLVKVFCSDCSEENEVAVDDLDGVDREVCQCGYGYVVISVANYSPVHSESGELIQLSLRRELDRAA